MLGEFSRAVEAADLAIGQAKAHDTLDRVEYAFELRANAREKLGQHAEALADVREAIALVERVRSDVVPTDSMKRGFAEQHQWLFTRAIDLLHRLGRDREALAAAEQGRARAFADLLAGRDSSPGSTTRPDAPPERAGRTDTVVVADGLRSRGGETPTNASGLLSDRDLRSLASATPLSAEELVRLTARLHSTLVQLLGSAGCDLRVGRASVRRNHRAADRSDRAPPHRARAADLDDRRRAVTRRGDVRPSVHVRVVSRCGHPAGR